MTEETITKICYTKAEVDSMIAFAVEEARRIDEASMAKHNREATIISMILGFTALAASGALIISINKGMNLFI